MRFTRSRRDEVHRLMIGSLAARNAISALLLVVAVVGIIVQIRNIQQGIVFPQTRFVLVGYAVIAVYALASIAVRVSAARRRS